MKKKPVQPDMIKSEITKPEETMNLMEENPQVIEMTAEQFSTMQQMFRTQMPMNLSQKSSEPFPGCEKLPKELNLADFSTMQMLFQTQYGTIPCKE
jgi:hypothetical protein